MRNFVLFIPIFTISTAVLLAYSRVNFSPVQRRDFLRWSWLWLGFTAAISLIPNYWLAISLIGLMCVLWIPNDITSRVTYYFFLVPALPMLPQNIRGLGMLWYTLTSPRLLNILILLVPLVKRTPAGSRPVPMFAHRTDKYVALYLVLIFFLDFRYSTAYGGWTITNSIRNLSYLIVDVAIPYFVISRYVQTYKDFVRVAYAILVSATILSIIAFAEIALSSPIYAWLSTYHNSRDAFVIVYRSGFLRAMTVFSSPIAFGYFTAIALAMLIIVSPWLRPKFLVWAIAGVLLLGLLSSISRGPWLGFGVFMVIYILFGPNKSRNVFLGLLSILGLLFFLLVVPGGDLLLSLLPFTGGAQEYDATVEGRRELLSNSLVIIERNFWFGSKDFLNEPELLSLALGSGFIDVTNMYLQMALKNGVVGLIVFLCVPVSVSLNVLKAIRQSRAIDKNLSRLGAVLLALNFCTLVVIGTVSSIGHIPVYYWALTALGVAYSLLARRSMVEGFNPLNMEAKK